MPVQTSPSRSSSPAKRSAAEMEELVGTKGQQARTAGQQRHIDQPASQALASNGDREASHLASPLVQVREAPEEPTNHDLANASAPSIEAVTDYGGSPRTATAKVTEEPDKTTIDAHYPALFQAIMESIREEGQIGYVLAQGWLDRVIARSSFASQHGPFDKSALEGSIGPVDNTAILSDTVSFNNPLNDENDNPFIPLRPGLQFGTEYQVLPEPAWQKITTLFGIAPGQRPITRFAHNTAPEGSVAENFQYEVYPPIFTLRRFATPHEEGATPGTAPALQIVASRSEPFQQFLRRLKKLLSIPVHTQVRLWRVLQVQSTSTNISDAVVPASTSAQRSPAVQPYISAKDFTAMVEGSQREMIDMNDSSASPKIEQSILLDTLGLSDNQILIVEESQTESEEPQFFSETLRKAGNRTGAAMLGEPKGLTSATTSGRNSPTPSAIMTRGRLRAGGRSKGTIGLQNLGNTCYMNSALQCIRAVEELTIFFLQGQWKHDLNADNPLGYRGNIAKAYAGLIGNVYSESQISAFAPRNFKTTLGRESKEFSGYGQQDSQEFMSFLVDGLHEDLNRIRKKPYRENPDSDDNTVHDPEAIRQLGETFRENHRARNDSVAMDLFNGFYKNTMICPECDKVSITFDPFSLLTLQLPVESTFQHRITFVPVRGQPVQIDVDIDKNSTFGQLKEYVAARIPGLDTKQLIFSEVYNHKFFKHFSNDKDHLQDARFTSKDDLVMYEIDSVPTNWPPRKKTTYYGRSMLDIHEADPMEGIASTAPRRDDNMLVPVFHRVLTESRFGPSSLKLTLWPSFIILSKQAARNEEEILRKVLRCAANTTTRDFLGEVEKEIGDSELDADLTTDDDASPTADTSVHAQSVDSEDGMVGITMHSGQTESLQSGARHISSILREGTPIPERLKKLFQLRILGSASDDVPTDWGYADERKQYPLLHSRIPKKDDSPSPASSADESVHATPATSDDEGGEDEHDSITFSNPVESIEGEAGSSPEPEVLKPGSSRNARTNRRGKKKQNTYTKKNRRMNSRQNTPQYKPSTSPEADASRTHGTNDNLIRLGEGIVLDWDTEIYQALFDEHGAQDARKDASVLSDPELERKRAVRRERKKKGASLEDCFVETAKGETLTEDNAWYCNRCKEKRMANKKLEIWTAPDILVVHLKRFSAARNFRDKLDILVDFPIEGLDLSDKVGLDEGKSLIYDLIAVDNHYGGLGGGHYTAFAKSFWDDKWYEYNDSQVSRVNNPEAVVTSAAYLLFYRRRSEIPLGPASLQNVVQSYYDPASSSEAASRSGSPTGQGDPKGQRLGDSFPNGSSSASAGEAAITAPVGGGSTLAAATDTRMIDRDPPSYEDEGLGLDDDDEGDMPPMYGPMQRAAGEWTWSHYDNAVMDDTSSNAAANGDDDGRDDLRSKLQEDFGDELSGQHPSSPQIRLHDMTDSHLEHYVGSSTMDEDDPVAEVHVDAEASKSDEDIK